MPKKNFTDSTNEITKLGILIRNLRIEKGLTLRKFAKTIQLAAPNLTGIENGKNSPSPEIYAKIISELKPDMKTHNKMDVLYSKIRKTPPPDVCDILLKNLGLCDKLKLLGNKPLTELQLSAIETFFASIKS